MKRIYQVGLITVAAAISAFAVAQGAAGPAKNAAEAKAAIDTRIALFKEIKKQNEPLSAMLKNQREFDSAVISASAAELQKLAAKIPQVYKVDTRGFKDIETRARDAIWIGEADFAQKADAFGKAAAAVGAVANSGDKAAIRKAIADMGRTCGGCHDNYQVKL